MSFRKKIIANYAARRGRPPVYATPKELWQGFVEYVNAVELEAVELPQSFVKGQNHNKLSAGKVARPLLLQGFMAFSGMGQSWGSYKYSKKDDPEFSKVIKNIELIVCSDQIEGALAGIYNSNITARLNGLSEHNTLSSGGKPLDLKFEIVTTPTDGESE